MRVLIIGLVALLVLLVAIFWKSVPLEGAEGIKNELQALEMSGAQMGARVFSRRSRLWKRHWLNSKAG